MTSYVLLLRAVNVGPRRVPMAELRGILDGAGLGPARTYLQSGNVVLGGDVSPASLAADFRELISRHFGFDVPVIVRTRDELEAVLALDPFAGLATEPKHYWVSFLDGELDATALERLGATVAGDERLHVEGRELYAWLPGGGGRSKLATTMASPARGVTATARNWATVAKLAAMAAELEATPPS